MSTLPLAVHTAAQVRALDRHAIEELQIPGYTLMTRAGEAALACAAQLLAVGAAHRGRVRSRQQRRRWLRAGATRAGAAPRGRRDRVCTSPDGLRGDARRAHDDFVAAGGAIGGWTRRLSRRRRSHRRCDLRHRAVAPGRPAIAARIIARSTSVGAPVLALDIPERAGCGHRRRLWAPRFVPSARSTFIGLKLGLLPRRGAELRRHRHVR